MSRSRLLRFWHAFAWLAVALAAGVRAAEETPVTVGGDPVHFSDVRCLADGTLAAGATIGGDGALLHSADGGLNWSLVMRSGDLAGVTPNFVDHPLDSDRHPVPLRVTGYRSTGTLQFARRLGPVLESADGGRSWSAGPALLPPQLRSNDPLARVPAPIVVDGEGRLAMARNYPDPVVLLSSDRGVSWAETRVPGIDTTLFHLAGDGRGRLVAVGAAQPLFGLGRLVVAHSDDSGRTWTVAMNEQADHLVCTPRVIGRVDTALMVYNPCRDRGKRYYLSRDGGRTWAARVFGPGRGAFELVGEVGGDRWVALSQDGPDRSLVVWISDNGGEDWRGQRTGFVGRGDLWLHMQKMLPLPDGALLAYIGAGQVLRIGDRGQSWMLIDTGLPRPTTLFMDSACTDGKGLVLLAGNKGMQLRSTDSGLTWQRGRIATTTP